MNKPNVAKMFKNARIMISKRGPEILTGVGIAGMVTTTVLAVKATPKAVRLIEEKKKAEHLDKLPPVDVVKVTWRCYIPAAVTATMSTACLIGASSVNVRRNAALYSAYKLSETAFSEYKEKVVETIGEKKDKAIKEQIAKDKVEKNPVSKTEIFVTGKGDTLFLDPMSNRYFTSDIEKIRKIINDLNWKMSYCNEMYVSLSELYNEIGLDRTKISDSIGWKISDGLIEPIFSAQVSDDGRPCLVLDFTKAPTYGFDEYY